MANVGRYGWYTPNDNRAIMTNQGIYNNKDHSITIDLFGDIQILSAYLSENCYEHYHDNIVHIVKDMTNTPPVMENRLHHDLPPDICITAGSRQSTPAN